MYEIFQPLKLSQIFELTWRLIEKNFKTILYVVGLPLVPFYLIFFIVMLGMAPQMISDPYWYLEMPSWLPFFLVIVVSLYVLAIFLCEAALVKVVGELCLENEVTLQKSYAIIFSKMGPLLWAASLSGLFIFLGFLLFVIPGIIIYLTFFLVVPIVLLEETRGMEALKRSQELMKGEKLKAFFFIFILGAVSGAVDAVLGMIPVGFVEQFFKMIFHFLFILFANVGMAIFYFQIKASKEALNREGLAKLMG